MESITIELTKEQKSRLDEIAAQRHTSVSTLVLEKINPLLRDATASDLSCYDLTAHLFAEPTQLGDGPPDLSTNKAYLQDLGK